MFCSTLLICKAEVGGSKCHAYWYCLSFSVFCQCLWTDMSYLHSMSKNMLFWWPPILLRASQSNRPKSERRTPLIVSIDLPRCPWTSTLPSWLWGGKEKIIAPFDQAKTNKVSQFLMGIWIGVANCLTGNILADYTVAGSTPTFFHCVFDQDT